MSSLHTHLPHFDQPNLIQHITFHLADSIPANLRAELQVKLENEPTLSLRKRFHECLDQGYGACILAEPACADVMQGVLLHDDLDKYRLLAWVIMPNHVHVLIRQLPGHPLARIVQDWKKFSAIALNRLLGLSGQVWHRDYYDRFMRTEDQVARLATYIHANPVSAGLVSSSEEWAFSSRSGFRR